MATVSDIKNELQSVLYPGFQKSIMDFGFVKRLKLLTHKVVRFIWKLHQVQLT